MFPSMNPGQMKKLMQQMGIKNTEIAATRVVIEREEGNLVIDNPQVTQVEMSGQKTLQISGEMHEETASDSKTGEKSQPREKDKSDVEIVMEKAKCTKEAAEKVLEEANGDIVEAIMLVEANK
ncbi:MAG: nascent polypeptide-associated complex protein [Candidatus Micrarchaeota archaeon]